MREVLAWEKQQATELLDQVTATLETSGRKDAAKLARTAWEAAELALIKGRHLNSLHHTAHVLDEMVRVIIQQMKSAKKQPVALTVTERDLQLGIVAAVFHDAGNAFEPKDEKKIRKQEVRDNPALRPAAIGQRSRHMQNGGVLVETFMRGATGYNFTEENIRVVRRLVEHHDDPTLATFLDDDKDKKEHLFVSDKEHVLFDIYPLSAILREADRLWMLTIPGIVCDLIRNMSAGKPWNPREQIEANVRNHQKEAVLYRKLFSNSSTKLGFEDNAAFYRSIAGKEDFRQLPEKARKLGGNEWITKVTEAWFIGP